MSVETPARAPAKRDRLPRSRAIARSVAGPRVDTFTLKACIDSLQRELAKVEALAAGHRADFERDRAEWLVAEMLTLTADMAAKEATARLEGELAAWRSRSWWRRLLG